MPRFASYDGTTIAYRRIGAGRPLVCLPGAPGRNPDYLGDLGGLAEGLRVELGTGWQLTVHPHAGHYPWLDDPDTYVANLRTFLD